MRRFASTARARLDRTRLDRARTAHTRFARRPIFSATASMGKASGFGRRAIDAQLAGSNPFTPGTGFRRLETRLGRHAPGFCGGQADLLFAHLPHRGLGLQNRARRADHVHGAARLDFSLAGNEHFLSRSHIARARNDRPALGDIGRRIGAGGRANLEHVTGSHLAVERHQRPLVARLHNMPGPQTLIDSALDTHEIAAGGSVPALEVSRGETAAERTCQARLQPVEFDIAERSTRQGGIERLAIASNHVVHIVGALHATLDLECRDTRLKHFGDMPDTKVIAWAQQAIAIGAHRLLFRRTSAFPGTTRKDRARAILQLISQATRLGAVASICRTAPHQS